MTETPKARQNLVKSLRRSRTEAPSSVTEEVVDAQPLNNSRVLIWKRSTKSCLPEHCCPKVPNLDKYFEVNTSDCEIYTGQDLKPLESNDEKGKKRRSRKKPVDQTIYDCIEIWDREAKRRLEKAIPRLELQSYLLENPNCEVYIGQDRADKKVLVVDEHSNKKKTIEPPLSTLQVKGRRGSKKGLEDFDDNTGPTNKEAATPNELLESPYSILTRINLKEVVTLEVFTNVLNPKNQVILTALLPKIDQTPQGLVDLFTNNMHFQSSLSLYQDLLAAGNFDPDVKLRNKMKRRRKENWDGQKEHQFEVYWGHKLDVHENMKDLDIFSNIQIPFLSLAQEVMEKQGKYGEAQEMEQKRKRLMQKQAALADMKNEEQNIELDSEEEKKKKVETNKKIADVMGMFPILNKKKNS